MSEIQSDPMVLNHTDIYMQLSLLVHFTSGCRTTSYPCYWACLEYQIVDGISNCPMLNPIRTKLLWVRTPRRKHLINHAPFTLNGVDIVFFFCLLVFYSSARCLYWRDSFLQQSHIPSDLELLQLWRQKGIRWQLLQFNPLTYFFFLRLTIVTASSLIFWPFQWTANNQLWILTACLIFYSC